MTSIQPSSKAFSQPLSSLIFLMCGVQLFIPAPLKASGFSSWDISIVFYFSSSPPRSLHLFLTFINVFLSSLYLSSHFSPNRSLLKFYITCVSLLFFLFYTDSFVSTVIEENNFQIPSNTTVSFCIAQTHQEWINIQKQSFRIELIYPYALNCH